MENNNKKKKKILMKQNNWCKIWRRGYRGRHIGHFLLTLWIILNLLMIRQQLKNLKFPKPLVLFLTFPEFNQCNNLQLKPYK